MRNLNYFSLPIKFKELSAQKNNFNNNDNKKNLTLKTFILVNDSLVIKNNKVFFIKNNINELSLKKKSVFLGIHKNILYYCTSVSDQVYKKASSFKNTNKLKIRDCIKLLNSFLASLITYGYSIQDWRRANNYCGKCGSRTLLKKQENFVICSNYKCKNKIFPRINPTVIMSIFYDDKILLARNKNWPENLYSCLAGFCENNESAEEAVKREAYEETFLKLANIKYKYSQAWPFSNNLMLGFTAITKKKLIKINEEEIEDAKWFSKEELVSLVKRKKLKLPTKFAIARHLIEDWKSGI